MLQEIIPCAVELTDNEKKILGKFFSMALDATYAEEKIQRVQDTFNRAEDPRLLLGNSVIVVLKNKEE